MGLNHARTHLLLSVIIIIFGLLNTSKPVEGQLKPSPSLQSRWGMQLDTMNYRSPRKDENLCVWASPRPRLPASIFKTVPHGRLPSPYGDATRTAPAKLIAHNKKNENFSPLPPTTYHLPPIFKLALQGDSQVARYQLQVDTLLGLMQQRLMVAHDVARWKWNHKRAIEDRQREQELLAQLRQQATAYNLEPDAASAFFQAQIEGTKLIQRADFKQWQREGVQAFANAPDLNLTLRPVLDKLSTQLLSALAELTPVLGCPTLQELIESRAQIILHGDGIDTTVRRTVLAPLLDVKDTSCHSTKSLLKVTQN